jgi:hypothetical protein
LVVDLDHVVALLDVLNLAPELFEVGKISIPHPNDEVLVCLVPPLRIFPLSIWLCVFEKRVDIILVCDTGLIDGDRGLL